MVEAEDWPESEKRSMAELQRAETLEALGSVISKIRQQFGFRFFKLYRAPIPRVSALRMLLLLTDLPEDFFEEFDAIGFTVEELARMRAVAPSQLTQWTTGSLRSDDCPNAKDARLEELLRRRGIARGVYVNIAPVDGPVRILSFFGKDEPLTVRDAERLTVISVQLLHRVNTLEMRRDGDDVGLTSLEIECLLLASQGYEANEIGRRLGLSSRTILYLANSVCSKLKTTNLNHAVAEALRCGFIS